MSDPNRGRYHKLFKREFAIAQERLRDLGGTVEPGKCDYEAFVYAVPGLRLIFYPHRTSASNYHIRVRTAGAFDKAVLRRAIFALAENTCTFQFPADRALHNEAVCAAIRAGREPTA